MILYTNILFSSIYRDSAVSWLHHNFYCREGKSTSNKSNAWIKIKTLLFLFLPAFLPCLSANAIVAEIALPAWVSDHMMLPAGIPFKITGMAEPNKTVSVRFAHFSATAASGDDGSWKVAIPSITPGIRSELIFTCNSEEKVISDVASGDIWLCSGQSNMQYPVSRSDAAEDAERDILNLDIRCFDGICWEKVKAGNVKKFSAVALYFAIEMARRQHLPFGIFVAARGGTGIDAWIPCEAFPDTESGREWKMLVNDPEVLKAARDDEAEFKPYGEHRLAQWGLGRAVPSSLYEKLIKPFGDLPISGVVWYQGESNASSVQQAEEYRLWLCNLIKAYRKLWWNPVLPFVIIQLPAYDPGTPESRKAWAVLQDMQARVARRTDFAGTVKIKDLGDLKNIHPVQKKEVGVRVAKLAWKLTHAGKS